MARLPALVDAIAANSNLPRTLVDYFARQLRAADIIVSKKSGAGAATMTFRDAAIMLAAVMSTSTATDAPIVFARMEMLTRRSIQDSPRPVIEAMQEEDRSRNLRMLQNEFIFIDALTLLIREAPAFATWESDYTTSWRQSEPDTLESISMEMMAHSAHAKHDLVLPGYARSLRVITYAPGLAAEIHLGRTWTAVAEDNAFHAIYLLPSKRRDELQSLRVDMLSTQEVGIKMLLALHEAVQAPAVLPRRAAKASAALPTSDVG